MKELKNTNQFLRKLKWILILLIFSMPGILAQISVSGTVADINGDLLIGVNIVIKGTTNGTISDIDGKYSITVPGNESTLVFSYIGFKAQEKPVGANTIIDVILEEDMQMLEEMVVVAYGRQKKSHLTGAVSSLKNDGLDEIPTARADKALQGKLAGVQVLNLNSEAGEAPVIRVRGMGSISANNSPLVVLDGYPVPDGLSMVNMGDVESIEVLKDAASSALYGSRAAGGVILITTKRGSETKTKYNFKMYAGVNNALKLPDMLSTEEYVELLYHEASLREQDPSVDGIEDNTLEFNRVTNPEKTAYLISKHVLDQPTDWVDEGMRDRGLISNYQLSASGGDQKKRFYISGNYNSEDGIMEKSTYDKFSIKTNLDLKLSDAITLGINFNPNYSKQERPRVNLTDYMRFQSWVPIKHNEATAAMTGKMVGDWVQVPDFYGTSISGVGLDGEVWNMVGQSPWSTGNQTPVSIRERTSRIYDTYRVQTNFYLAFDILPGLQFKTSNGIYFSYKEYNQKEQSEANKAGLPNELTRETTLYTDLLSENLLTYNKIFGDHTIDGLLGFTLQKTSDNYNRIVGTGFPDEERLSFNMASELIKNSSSSSGITSFYYSEALVSALGRLNYAYKGRYMLSASLRADGSSKFAKGHKWGVFPSGSIGWRISQEDFMQNVNAISNLKIRASYGLTGNNRIPQYSYLNCSKHDRLCYRGRDWKPGIRNVFRQYLIGK